MIASRKVHNPESLRAAEARRAVLRAYLLAFMCGMSAEERSTAIRDALHVLARLSADDTGGVETIALLGSLCGQIDVPAYRRRHSSKSFADPIAEVEGMS